MSTTVSLRKDRTSRRKDRTHWLYIGVVVAVFAGVLVGWLAPAPPRKRGDETRQEEASA